MRLIDDIRADCKGEPGLAVLYVLAGVMVVVLILGVIWGVFTQFGWLGIALAAGALYALRWLSRKLAGVR